MRTRPRSCTSPCCLWWKCFLLWLSGSEKAAYLLVIPLNGNWLIEQFEPILSSLFTNSYVWQIVLVIDRSGNFHVKNNLRKKFCVDKFSWFCSILKIFLCKMFYSRLNFRSWSELWNYFNGEIFPIYGVLSCVYVAII